MSIVTFALILGLDQFVGANLAWFMVVPIAVMSVAIGVLQYKHPLKLSEQQTIDAKQNWLRKGLVFVGCLALGAILVWLVR